MRKIRADRRLGLLLGGVLLLAFIAIAATVAVPATDASLRHAPEPMSANVANGMRVYRNEGCWYCHTSYDRDTGIDAGKALGASAYAGRSPALLGLDRFGPDLTHGPSIASRADLVRYLRTVHGSMPSYAYLSQKDVDALAAFLLSLR
jgi:cbb3-type cytochrome oxidase cytochrome c subunit